MDSKVIEFGREYYFLNKISFDKERLKALAKNSRRPQQRKTVVKGEDLPPGLRQAIGKLLGFNG